MNPRVWAGGAIVAVIVVAAVFAPQLSTHSPTRSSVDFLQSASWGHLFGTDDLGRDVFSRVLHGARISLVVGVGAGIVAAVLGVPIGLLAGYRGGKVDLFFVQMIDLFIAIPALVLAMIITVMVGVTIENLVLVLGFVSWPTVARLVRGQVMNIRESLFVEGPRGRWAAARCGSCGRMCSPTSCGWWRPSSRSPCRSRSSPPRA